jgi:carbonic anhydrase/acetyltransferase-like protein (isoleucine patch superfamily)
MLIEHRGRSPQVSPSAYVAPTAVVCGDVWIGPESRVLFGAVITAEDGAVKIGSRCVVMEQAVIRGRARHPTVVGDNVMIGPHAHLNGTRVDEGRSWPPAAPCFPAPGSGREPRSGSTVWCR